MLLRCRIPLAHFELDVDVTFDARVTSIFGPSGSGKTTLLDAIAGLRHIAAGEIESQRQNAVLLGSWNQSAHLETGASATFPRRARCFRIFRSGKISYSERTRDMYGKSKDISVNHVLDVLEIGNLLDRPVTKLSGGEAQRVALARAILSHPQLLLLDEPLAALDIGLKERILPYLRRVRDEFAIPMIYVTHNLTEVLTLADWVLMIRTGKLIAQGIPREATCHRRWSSGRSRRSVREYFDAWIRLSPTRSRSGPGFVWNRAERSLFPICGNRRITHPGAHRGDDILVGTRRPEADIRGQCDSRDGPKNRDRLKGKLSLR